MSWGGHARVTPVVKPSVRALCKEPYPGHPKGCPNYGERETCPPQAPFIDDVIMLRRPVFVVYNVFPFGKHVEEMRIKHPDWSERQLANCLYWQNTARKQLRERVEAVVPEDQDLVVLYVPEACGVDVTATMKSIGHELEWPPKTVAYQVALMGHAKRKKA